MGWGRGWNVCLFILGGWSDVVYVGCSRFHIVWWWFGWLVTVWGGLGVSMDRGIGI